MYDIPDGLIAHLTRECGGNVHECVVVITASSVLETEHAPMNAVDLTTEQVFGSDVMTMGSNVPHARNNWIQFDFKERRVVPTHCAIRACPYSNRIKSWVLEGSLDGESWLEIDKRENTVDLAEARTTCMFTCNTNVECSLVRLVNIGKSHAGDDNVVIAALELFGSLIE
jgi:hypothetical protein